MKYAADVIDLLGAYPGREFRMAYIVNYVTSNRVLNLKERRTTRKAILRVLQTLADSGHVMVRPPNARRGGYAQYIWRPR